MTNKDFRQQDAVLFSRILELNADNVEHEAAIAVNNREICKLEADRFNLYQEYNNSNPQKGLSGNL